MVTRGTHIVEAGPLCERCLGGDQDLVSAALDGLAEDLKTAYSEGQGGRGTLDYLRIVSEPTQTAAQYRRMIGEVQSEYLEVLGVVK